MRSFQCAPRWSAWRVILTGVTMTAATATFAVGVLETSSPASAAVSSMTELSGGEGNSLSCTGPTTCTGVDGPLEETMTNGVWSGKVNNFNDQIEFSISPGDAAISSADATDCTAVGSSVAGEPAYVVETDGVWSAVQTMNIGRGGNLDAVSCSDALDCTAVGTASLQEPDGNYGNTPVSATEINGIWVSLTKLPAPSVKAANDPLDELDVSCTSPGNCVAAGDGYATYIDNDYHPIFATETNGSWAPYEVSSVDVNEMGGLSCPDANHCTAVGGGLGLIPPTLRLSSSTRRAAGTTAASYQETISPRLAALTPTTAWR